MVDIAISAGGRGTAFPRFHDLQPTDVTRVERVNRTAKLYAEEFRNDPVITYQVAGMGDARFTYLEEWYTRVLTAAAMNDAIFHDAGDWKSVGCLMSPGRQVGNPFTIIQAGFFPLLWAVGIQGIRVRTEAG
jgi:hypothetical protein